MPHDPISIRVEQVSKKFKDVVALRGVSLHLEAGLMHGVIGPEGAGKTTLMRLLLGLLKPSEGNVEYFREGKRMDFEEFRPHIAYMPQQQSLYADLSIDEHLEFFRVLYSISDDAFRTKREEL